MRKSRRRFLASSLTALGAAASSAASPASAGEAASRNVSGDAPFRLIFETEWNDMPCADYPLTRERWVEECIHPLAGTQVDTMLYNLCSSDGYVAELKSGELLMHDFDKLGDAW